MKYEFGQFVYYSKAANKDELYVFILEHEGDAVICVDAYYDDYGWLRRSKIIVVPFSEISPNDEFGILPSNEIESIFPSDIQVGDQLVDNIGKIYNVLAVKPIVFPHDNICSLLIQDGELNITEIPWAYIKLKRLRDNWFYEQNLSKDKFSKVYYDIKKLENYDISGGQDLVEPFVFSFSINSSNYMIFLKDFYLHEGEIDFFYIYEKGIPKNIEGIAVSAERSCESINNIKLHINSEHVKCESHNINSKKSCDKITLNIASGILSMKNNENEYFRFKTIRNPTITVHTYSFIDYPENCIKEIDIYIDGVCKYQGD